MDVDPHKAPQEFGALTYLIVIGLSALGGLVKYLLDVQSRKVKQRYILELCVDIVTSAFVGLLVFWACTANAVPELWTAVAVGVAAHMGTRALAIMGRVVRARIEILSGSAKDDEK